MEQTQRQDLIMELKERGILLANITTGDLNSIIEKKCSVSVLIKVATALKYNPEKYQSVLKFTTFSILLEKNESFKRFFALIYKDVILELEIRNKELEIERTITEKRTLVKQSFIIANRLKVQQELLSEDFETELLENAKLEKSINEDKAVLSLLRKEQKERTAIVKAESKKQIENEFSRIMNIVKNSYNK